jgi:NADPH-dependent 2,4-dienoyl-CoA reductase/sulfur reductase-like enzyme
VARRLVIVGGDAAGMSAAMQARRHDRTIEIVALERGRWASYSACGIPYLVGGEVDGGIEELVARTPQEFREHHIDLRLRHEVTGIDLEAGAVDVHNLEHNRRFRLGFDLLHIATGARPRRPDLPGIDLPTVRGVQTLDDAAELLRHAEHGRCEDVVVVGGGYIGLEMAEAFVRWGARCVLVEGASQVMSTLDPDMAAHCEEALRRFGVDVRTGVSVTGFEEGVVHTEGGDVRADLVVLGLGVEPNGELAAAAGIATGARDAISVDRQQRTSHEAVWAAGDCCESYHLVSQRHTYIALGTIANRQGRVAGTVMGGGYATFPGVVGTAATKVCSTEVARTGLTEREARDAGFGFAATTVESSTQAGYLRDAGTMHVKLVGELGTGRILGAQIVGDPGSGKRIDVVALALHAGFTCDQLVDADLSYAPPFGPLWDPVAVAARQLAREL